MTIIDLRPYEKQPPTRPLAGILIDCCTDIRGVSKITYEVPDEIWVTKTQATQFEYLSVDMVTFNIDGTQIPVSVKIKDELTS